MSELKEQRQSIIVFLSISVALFLACIGFYAWNTARLRSYELDYVKIQGTIVDVKLHTSTGKHSSSYYYVVSYSYEDKDYTFTDRTGHYEGGGKIGGSVQIYVNPQNPNQAEVVTSAGFASIICACFFAFFCVTYATGMNILLTNHVSTFKKRLKFVWGAEVLLGITLLLLFWLGLPNSGFGGVFMRIEGAVGVTVVSGLVLLVSVFDGIITYKLHSQKAKYYR